MASNQTLTVGLAGLSSKLCRLIARQLLTRPNVSIRGYVRDPTKVPKEIVTSPRVQIIQGEALNREAVQSFVQGCNVVVCGYLGPDDTMIQGQKILVDACEIEGVARYFPSDFTLDYTKLELGQLDRKDPMIYIKAYIEERQAQGSKVRGVYVLIMGFIETLFSSYFQFWIGKEKKLQAWGSLDEPVWEMTSYKTTAEYTAELILDEKAVGIQKFLGEKASVRAIAAVMKESYNIKSEVVRLGSLDELYPKMHAVREEGTSLAWIAMFYQYYLTNGQTLLGPVGTLDNKRYPNVKAESLKDFFRRVPLEELNDAYGKLGKDA